MPDTPLTILYRDTHYVAINKPSGLLVHRSTLDRHETRFAVQLLRDQIGMQVSPVHRLDRGTSGVLLFALNKDALIAASQCFESGTVEKHYRAIVRGWPEEAGAIDHPLTRIYDDAEFRPEQVSEAQAALTRYTRLARIELPFSVDRYASSRYAYLALYPVTGRRHQLRRHLKHIAHPIIGDATYGKGRHNRFFAEHFGANHLLLSCTRLRLTHPLTGEALDVQTNLPDAFERVLRDDRWCHDIQVM